MVLHHIAQCANFLIKTSASLHTKILRHGDLHALDIVAIPDRFQKRIGKAEVQQILYRLLAQVVINAKYIGFIKRLGQHGIEL